MRVAIDLSISDGAAFTIDGLSIFLLLYLQQQSITGYLVDHLLISDYGDSDIENILAPVRQTSQALLAATKNLIRNCEDDEAWKSAEYLVYPDKA